MAETWYEIHSVVDGHVASYGDREFAEARADEREEEFGYKHKVKEVQA